jgi:hypothetical protein
MSAHRNIRGTILLSAGIFCALVIGFAPVSTQAATGLNVRQVLPPAATNNAACAPILVSEVQPHIYGGALHSFDFSITAPSYVALGGSVGNMPVDFQYMSRWREANGNIRIHVDVPTTPLTSDLPINIVLISAAGQVTCTATVSTVIPKMIFVPQYPTTPTYPSSPTPSHPSRPAQQTETPKESHVTPPTKPVQTGKGSTTPTESATSAPMFVGVLHSMGNICQVGGASKLWTVLLVLYALFVLTLLLQKPDTFGLKSLEWNIALILLLFLGLVAFWYLSLACRTGTWALLLSTAIAVFGLLALLILGQPETRPVLLLKDKEEQEG